jgi:pimeloyl-ACP methyl ester carboxylesterase
MRFKTTVRILHLHCKTTGHIIAKNLACNDNDYLTCSYIKKTERRMNVMSEYSHETVPTQFVGAKSIEFAYRRFGKQGGIPLIFLNYFGGTLDDWDPVVTNGLALDHDIVLVDAAGVAASTGATPNTMLEMAKYLNSFCVAMDFKEITVVGFSIGGMIAQQMALDYPKLVHRLILLGTGPHGGEGMTFTELSAEESADPVGLVLAAFFAPTETSQAAGKAYLERLAWRRENRDKPVSNQSSEAQLAAIREWGAVPSSNRYATLKNISQKTLIVHGNKDIVVQPINALILAEQLPNARLVVYPDASHAAQYQHASSFLKIVNMFLNA